MEQKKPVSHVIAGIIIAGILVVYSIITSIIFGTGASGNPGSGWITYLVIIAGLIYFIHSYGKSRDFYAPFGDLFSYGFKATATFTFIFVIFIVLLSFAIPNLKEKAIEATRTALEKQGRLSDSDIENAMQLTNKFFWVFMIGGTMLGFVIIGAIGSLLGAAITKKRPYNPLENPYNPLEKTDV
jgi:hypothetical protein